MSTLFQLREFDRDADYAMVSGWFSDHGKPPVPLCMLPLLGIVVHRISPREDVAALWLYMDNSTGVCFVERAVTMPGLSISDARDSLLFGLEFLKLRAAEMDYGVMCLRTYPALARYAKMIGFVEDDRRLVSMSMFTKPIEKETLCQ